MQPLTAKGEARLRQLEALERAKVAKRALIRALCDHVGPRFVTFTYIKADGTVRHLTTCNRASVGLAKDPAPHRVRAVATAKANNPEHLRRYDVHAKGWRIINLDTVTALRLDGVTVCFDDLTIPPIG